MSSHVRERTVQFEISSHSFRNCAVAENSSQLCSGPCVKHISSPYMPPSQEEVDSDSTDDWTPEQLTHHEKWWVRQLPFLEEAGYTFRPRYRPGWEASWKANNGFFEDYEDGQFQPVSVASVVVAHDLMLTLKREPCFSMDNAYLTEHTST